jgi:hypothetical protein
MSAGEFNEKIIGDKATIKIGANVYQLKLNFGMNDGAPAERSANSSGLDYAFGAQDGTFVCEIEASTPDLTVIEGWRRRSATGAITAQTVVITLPGVTTGSTTATFSAKFHRYEIISTSPDGFVLVRLDSVISSETVTWA